MKINNPILEQFISQIKGKKIKITKLTDDAFEGTHPNGIYVGYEKIGIAGDLVIGERFHVISEHVRDNFSTSPVVAVKENNIIQTTYSHYKVEILED